MNFRYITGMSGYVQLFILSFLMADILLVFVFGITLFGIDFQTGFQTHKDTYPSGMTYPSLACLFNFALAIALIMSTEPGLDLRKAERLVTLWKRVSTFLMIANNLKFLTSWDTVSTLGCILYYGVPIFYAGRYIIELRKEIAKGERVVKF